MAAGMTNTTTNGHTSSQVIESKSLFALNFGLRNLSKDSTQVTGEEQWRSQGRRSQRLTLETAALMESLKARRFSRAWASSRWRSSWRWAWRAAASAPLLAAASAAAAAAACHAHTHLKYSFHAENRLRRWLVFSRIAPLWLKPMYKFDETLRRVGDRVEGRCGKV